MFVHCFMSDSYTISLKLDPDKGKQVIQSAKYTTKWYTDKIAFYAILRDYGAPKL